MANFTISTPLSPEGNYALRTRLNEVLVLLKYFIKPGPRRKDQKGGGLGYFLMDLVDGKLIVCASDDNDPALAAWLREQAAVNRDLEDGLLGLAKAIERALDIQRRRENAEFDAELADLNPPQP